MKYVPITEARSSLPDLVDSEEVSVITRQGRPVSVLLSFDAYRSMQADLEMAADPRDYLASVESHRRAMAGDFEGFVEYDPDDEEFGGEGPGGAPERPAGGSPIHVPVGRQGGRDLEELLETQSELLRRLAEAFERLRVEGASDASPLSESEMG